MRVKSLKFKVKSKLSVSSFKYSVEEDSKRGIEALERNTPNAESPTENRELKTYSPVFSPLFASLHSVLSTQYSVLFLLLLAACAAPTPAAPVGPPTVINKLLATVYISPTPDAAQVQATRAAVVPTVTAPLPTPTDTNTPYIGVFLGEADAGDDGPAINVTPQLPNPTAAEITAAIAAPGCAAQVEPSFGTQWNSSPEAVQRMGCAIQVAEPFRGVLQVFERGVMYWRGDTNEIWAVATTGPSAGHYWYVTDAPSAPDDNLTAPEGLRVPVRGFGSVWRTTGGVRDALGYARLDEQPASMQTQRFDGGTLFLDATSGQVFVLLVDGRVFGPY
jgi:hypothetical protein